MSRYAYSAESIQRRANVVQIIYVMPYLRPVKANEVRVVLPLDETSADTEARQMNYSSVYLVGILVFAYGYWFIRGKKFYVGPISQSNPAYTGVDPAQREESHSSEDETKDEK